jgi:hypothetical protein
MDQMASTDHGVLAMYHGAAICSSRGEGVHSGTGRARCPNAHLLRAGGHTRLRRFQRRCEAVPPTRWRGAHKISAPGYPLDWTASARSVPRVSRRATGLEIAPAPSSRGPSPMSDPSPSPCCARPQTRLRRTAVAPWSLRSVRLLRQGTRTRRSWCSPRSDRQAASAVEREAAGDPLIVAVVLDGGGALGADRGVEHGERGGELGGAAGRVGGLGGGEQGDREQVVGELDDRARRSGPSAGLRRRSVPGRR